MPCNMGGPSAGETAREKVAEAEREITILRRRVAALEEALCGLCQQLSSVISENPQTVQVLHPQLQTWFDNHQRLPGCSLNTNGD